MGRTKRERRHRKVAAAQQMCKRHRITCEVTLRKARQQCSRLIPPELPARQKGAPWSAGSNPSPTFECSKVCRPQPLLLPKRNTVTCHQQGDSLHFQQVTIVDFRLRLTVKTGHRWMRSPSCQGSRSHLSSQNMKWAASCGNCGQNRTSHLRSARPSCQPRSR